MVDLIVNTIIDVIIIIVMLEDSNKAGVKNSIKEYICIHIYMLNHYSMPVLRFQCIIICRMYTGIKSDVIINRFTIN